MDIDVLGPLVAREGGTSVVPTAAKPRKVLAMLTVHADQVVPMASLFEELWGEDIPRSANTTVQTYILHLRNLIGAALDQSPADGPKDAKRVLVTYPGGYLLDTMGGRVDVHEFDRLAALGHRAREMGDYEAASRTLHRGAGDLARPRAGRRADRPAARGRVAPPGGGPAERAGPPHRRGPAPGPPPRAARRAGGARRPLPHARGPARAPHAGAVPLGPSRRGDRRLPPDAHRSGERARASSRRPACADCSTRS